jgi:hypothetical protein
MADPISLTALGTSAMAGLSSISGSTALTAGSMGLSALGGILGASGASASGASASQLGMYQAGIAMQNAAIARQNAAYASAQGEQEAAKYGMGARQKAGEILTAQSASGLDVGSGSAKAVRDSQHLVSSIDMAQIRANAAKAAYDYNVQAGSFQQEAMLDIMGAKNAKAASKTNALTSIVGAASSVADKWLQASKVGMFGSGKTALGNSGGYVTGEIY